MPADKLKVFLSWSGTRSLAVAEALRDWLPDVLMLVEPWLSADDVEKGTKWSQVISGSLQEANFAVICLTPENLESPWLLFEAGALSKHANSRVCTYLLGLQPSQVRDPLSQFQHTKADKADTRKLLETVNKHLGESAIGKDRLDRAFETWWPSLEKRLSEVPDAPDDQRRRAGRRRGVDDLVSDILEHVREQGRVLLSVRDAVLKQPGSEPQTDEDSVIMRVFRKLGEQGIGVRVLSTHPEGLLLNKQKVLPTAPVLAFLEGKISAGDLIARAKHIPEPVTVTTLASSNDIEGAQKAAGSSAGRTE